MFSLTMHFVVLNSKFLWWHKIKGPQLSYSDSYTRSLFLIFYFKNSKLPNCCFIVRRISIIVSRERIFFVPSTSFWFLQRPFGMLFQQRGTLNLRGKGGGSVYLPDCLPDKSILTFSICLVCGSSCLSWQLNKRIDRQAVGWV